MKRVPLKRRSTFTRSRKLTKSKKRPLKKPSARLLKDKLWRECKRIIRHRYGNVCYTCGKQPLEGANWHTGHFIASSVCSTEMRYDLDNLRPQCWRCNINLSGNWVAFERHLLVDGIDVAALKQRNEDTKNLSYRSDWFLAKIAEYRALWTPEAPNRTNPYIFGLSWWLKN